ncbi:restriction endonuclease subunit S [Rhodoferax sp.]|uniref:restriction endonuclease subunit S n=1 Tax=Rhodoferax sp. TaxID=50421 RepID=UPI002730E3BB|nr:restriction endonuclease subunit S [Rhodoferax sp.]MDP1527883.1 restriction endonuclease subunit S [Rhodoferax sp.]MDP1944504.1 restriction endonuclease subunit S [Rhodoferax sp.]MDP2440152.1 restriction endonuclease subunit S [Rhodoferax sp.]MDZ4208862.1 restriction endonuclease subunit S [Rhodoferax sp.]
MTEKSLKPGWHRVKFGDVVRLTKARCADPLADGVERYVGLEHLEPGDLRIRSWGNVADGVTFTSVFRPGQVLFGKRRAYQRKVAVADFSGVCSGDIYVMETKDTQVLMPELLPFICQTDAFFDHAVGTSAGSLSPRTNWTSLADFEFALPPMNEQVRLIELLSAALESADTYKSAVKSAQKMLRSSLVSIFALDGHSPATSEICHAALRPGWRLVSASELCIAPITKGATPPGGTGSMDTGIPFLKVYNLTFDGELDFTIDPTFISDEAHTSEVRRSQIAAGDVLMNIVGPPLGKVSIVPPGFPSANINQAIARFRMPENSAATFMAAYLLSDWAQRWLSARSKKTSGQKNLTLELCQTLPVPFPPDDCLGDVVSSIEAAFESVRLVEARKLQVDGVYKAIIMKVLGNV